MKSWLIFGFGVTLGGVCGAFLTAFILFDDLTHKTSSADPRMAMVKTLKSDKPKAIPASAVVLPEQEARPQAVAAEAVDPDSLPAAAPNGVISTAKRDDAAAAAAASPH